MSGTANGSSSTACSPASSPGAWVLKGDFALDLRLADRARTTKDVDLVWRAEEAELLDVLLDAVARDLDDFFVFGLERSDTAPDLLGGAHRFRVTVSLAKRPFESFVLDVGIDESRHVVEDVLTTDDVLGFAGIAPVTIPALPLATQVAEKVHAYTRTYEGGRGSTRTKDLIDLALIASLFSMGAAVLRTEIEAVFARRDMHEPPAALPPPPVDWRRPYQRLALTVSLDGDLDTGHAHVAAMLDPVLGKHVATGTWDPESQTWMTA